MFAAVVRVLTSSIVVRHMEIKVLYEDEDILAIDKPAGLVVHSDGRTEEPSVSEWFASIYPESRDVGEKIGEISRPGIVHRLDRETSGVLLLAKTDVGFDVLKSQFQARSISKKYHLFATGLIEDDRGTINKPIARSATNFRKRAVGGRARGEAREAITYFQVLKRSPEHRTTFVEAVPKTGRTHQIRVHFDSIHHPVIKDNIYGPKKGGALGFDRLALHARSLSFKNVSGESITITAPYPLDFKHALDTVGLGVLD